ncbi:glycerol-3-phosphate acyltransferase, partial [Candidatus Neomarinimicrobiota bacterium]
LAIWILVIILTGYVSIGSVTAVTLFPLVSYLREGTLINSLGIFSLVIVAFIWFTHRSNAARLFRGEEYRFDRARLFRKSK